MVLFSALNSISDPVLYYLASGALKHLQTLVSAGRLGSIADRFHCVPTEYSHRKTLEMDAPLILSRCIEDEVDVVMLVPL